MAGQSIDNFYHDLGFRVDDEQLKSFPQWTVLHHGLVTLLVDKKETYECEIHLVPAYWHNMFSKWHELTEEEKKKFIIKRKVLVDYLGYIIPGTILNGPQLKVKKDKKEIVVIPVYIESKKIKPDFLKNLVDEDILKKTPFYQDHSTLPCIKIEVDDKTFLLPTSEIARYYFFKGVKIPRCLTLGLYRNEFEDSALLLKNQQTETKSAFVSIKPGYTKEERFVFAELALNEKMRQSADYIKSNIHFCLTTKGRENLAYIKTNFFQEGSFEIASVGDYLDPPHNTIFCVNQIIDTSESLVFDLLRWLPFGGDRRSWKDEKRRELPKKSYKGKKTAYTPGKDPHLNPAGKPDPTSIPQPLEISDPEESFYFPKKEIQEIKGEKISQDVQYEGNYIIVRKTGNIYTTNERGEQDSEIIKGYFTELERKQSEALNAEFLEDLDKSLTSKFKWGIEYFHEQDENIYFKDIRNAIKMLDPKISCTILKLERLEKCFYLFEYSSSNSYLNRTTLLHDPNGMAFNSVKIKNILAAFTESNYSWTSKAERDAVDKDPRFDFVVIRGFNRNRGKKTFTIEQIAENINDYITKEFPELVLLKKPNKSDI